MRSVVFSLFFVPEFNPDGSKKSVELKIVNLQLVGETDLNMKRWEEIGVWQTGVKAEPNKTAVVNHGGEQETLLLIFKDDLP